MKGECNHNTAYFTLWHLQVAPDTFKHFQTLSDTQIKPIVVDLRECKLGLLGCFPLCQRFRKFRSEFKWKGPFRFLPTGIFGITFGGGPLISVGIFRSKFAVPFLTNRFFALIREFGNVTKWQELFLIGWRGLIGKCRSIFLG